MAEEEKEKEAMDIVTKIHEKIEKYGKDSAEVKEFIAKTKKTLEAQEDKNQKLVAQIAEEKNLREELGEKYDAMQVEMIRKTSGGKVDYKETEEYKALNLMAKGGLGALDSEQKALLRSDSDVDGGYLTNSEFDTEIIRKITEISAVRQQARVRTVGRKTLEMPKRDSIPTAAYEGEAVAADDSTSSYGTETVTTFRLTTSVPFTMDMLLASGFDIESEISQDVSESFAQTEGLNFVSGDGAKKPEGFLVHPDVISGARETSVSGGITAKDLILLTGDLKVGYNPMYAFNRRTLATLRTQVGGDGQFIWQSGLAAGAPNTLNGLPYLVMEDMPDIVSGNLAVMFADFRRGYTIIDRTGMTVIRDNLTRAKENIIELTFHRYNTGQVVLSEAFKALKIKA